MLPFLILSLACSGNKEPTSTAPAPAPEPEPAPAAEPAPAPTPPRDGVMMARSLCRAGEHVHFSCALPEARAVSLCGTERLTGPAATLQLRVGLNPERPDVQWPPGTERSVEAFASAVSDAQLAVHVGTGRVGHAVFIDADGGGYSTLAPNGVSTDTRCLGTPAGDLAKVAGVISVAPFWR